MKISNNLYHFHLAAALKIAGEQAYSDSTEGMSDLRLYFSPVNWLNDGSPEKQLPKGIVQLIHVLPTKCFGAHAHKTPCKCFCIKQSSRHGEVGFHIDEHLMGECPHRGMAKEEAATPFILPFEHQLYDAFIVSRLDKPGFILFAMKFLESMLSGCLYPFDGIAPEGYLGYSFEEVEDALAALQMVPSHFRTSNFST
jgi:hypothetical protein